MLRCSSLSQVFSSWVSQISVIGLSAGQLPRVKRSRRRMCGASSAAGKTTEVLEDRFLLAGAIGVDNSLGSPTDLQNLKGDFDGDGNDDIARLTETGEWQIGLSDGAGSYNFSKWSRWKASTLQDVQIGDFNGDGRDDLAGLFGNGLKKNWWVGISNGSRLVNQRFARWDTSSGLDQVHVGDFNGDGRDDLAGLFGSGARKTWEVGLANGAEFVTEQWTAWNTRTLDQVQVGDFDGDGRDDIAGLFGSGAKKSWRVGVSTNSGFETQRWARWNTSGGLDNVMVGDFNGDGKDDLAGLFQGKHWRVGVAGNNSFDLSRWATWSFASEGLDQLEVEDVDGDGDDDIVGLDAAGHSWVSHSSGMDFSLEYDAARDARAGSVELLDDGTLRIDGTGFSDDVVVELEGGNLVARLEGGDDTTTDDDIYARFDVDTVSRILFTGGDGDDRFVNRTDIDSEAHGGDGDDTLVGGAGDDALFGDRGRDRIRGRRGNDSLRGGLGRDRLEGGSGSDDFLENESDDLFEDEDAEDRRHDQNINNQNSTDNNGNDHNETDHNETDRNGNGHDGNNGNGNNGIDNSGTGRDSHDHNGTDHNGNGNSGTDHDGTDHNGNDHSGTDHDGNSGSDRNGNDHDSNNGTGHDGQDHDGTDHDGNDHNGTDHDGNGNNVNGNDGTGHDGNDHSGTDHDGNDHDGNDHDGNDHDGNDRDRNGNNGNDRNVSNRRGNR